MSITLFVVVACVQTSPISFVARGNGPFSASTKEIGDVYTQAIVAVVVLLFFSAVSHM